MYGFLMAVSHLQLTHTNRNHRRYIPCSVYVSSMHIYYNTDRYRIIIIHVCTYKIIVWNYVIIFIMTLEKGTNVVCILCLIL